jgi:hypothetical protein
VTNSLGKTPSSAALLKRWVDGDFEEDWPPSQTLLAADKRDSAAANAEWPAAGTPRASRYAFSGARTDRGQSRSLRQAAARRDRGVAPRRSPHCVGRRVGERLAEQTRERSNLSALISHSYARLFRVLPPRSGSRLDHPAVLGTEMSLRARTPEAIARTLPRAWLRLPKVSSAHRPTEAAQLIYRTSPPLSFSGGKWSGFRASRTLAAKGGSRPIVPAARHSTLRAIVQASPVRCPRVLRRNCTG